MIRRRGYVPGRAARRRWRRRHACSRPSTCAGPSSPANASRERSTDPPADGARRRRRPAGPVRAVDVHRLLVPPGRLRPGPADGRPRGPPRRPGHAAAGHHPPRLTGRLLAAEPGRPPRPAAVVGAGATNGQCTGDGGRRRAGARRARGRPASCRARSWRPSPARAGPTRRAVHRPRAGAAVGHVGTPAGRPLRRRRDVDRPAPDLGEDDALDHLVRRYLSGFGPATANEIASWAGMTVGDITPVARPPRAAPVPHRGRQGPRRPARAARCPRPTAPTASASSAPGRPCSWSTPAGPGSSARRTAPGSSACARRTRSTRSSSTASSRAPGGSTTARVEMTPWRPLPRDARRLLRDEADALATFHDEVADRPGTPSWPGSPQPAGGGGSAVRSRWHDGAVVFTTLRRRLPARSSGRRGSTGSPRPRRCRAPPTPSSRCRSPVRCSSASAPTPPASRCCSTC